MEVLCVDYVTTKEASKKTGNTWLVPVDAEKPADGRYRSSKVKDVKINETDILG